MRLPTDPKPHLDGMWLALIAILVLAGTQLAGFIHSAALSGKRNGQITKLQGQLDSTQKQLTVALASLASADATLADLRRGLAALGREKHVSPADIRRLERRTQPRVVVVPTPVPGPTVTRTMRPEPSPGPTKTVTVRPRCPGTKVGKSCLVVPKVTPTLPF